MEKVSTTLLALLLAASARAERGGVLFYAGFEGTAEAVAVGSGTAQGHDGGPKFSAGRRGQALLSGEGAGGVTYAVEGNLRADRGSVEFWVCPQDWAGTDHQFHIFFDARGPGWLLVYKFTSPGQGLFLISERRETESWDTIRQDLRQFKPGEWHHLAATWNRREARFYLDGQPSAPARRPQIPEGLSGRFFVGDQSWQSGRRAHSLIDELYIYDRALSPQEVAWAYEHAADRPLGQDLPEDLTPLVSYLDVQPFPSRQELHVEVDLNERFDVQRFTGSVRLEPSIGQPVPLRPLTERSGQAVVKFTELPPGRYEVHGQVQAVTARGQIEGTASASFTSPGPPAWRGNQIGLTRKVPPPWTPLQIRKAESEGRKRPPRDSALHPSPLAFSVECWGRRYTLGELGLPGQILSADAELLAAPVELRAVRGGQPLKWQAKSCQITSEGEAEARVKGMAVSKLGRLTWQCRVEFDGMVRYDLSLAAREAVDALELVFPLQARHAPLHHLMFAGDSKWGFFWGTPRLKCTDYWGDPTTLRGAVPAGRGVVFRAPWVGYFWFGDEERGLAAFCESDEAWDRLDRDDGFRIERKGGGTNVVWSFANRPWRLPKTWQFTFGLQATPVKPKANWRHYRLMRDHDFAINQPPVVGGNVVILWVSDEQLVPYHSYPEAVDEQKYQKIVAAYHARGVKVVPYSSLLWLDANAPEAFYLQDWQSGRRFEVLQGISPAADWADFMVWKHAQYVRRLDLDGLYLDGTGIYPSTNRAAGFGYVRDGRVRPTYPFFATRRLYQRIYTMLREYGQERQKETFLMAHTSTKMLIPVLSFCDATLDGEQFWGGPLNVEDDYLKVMPLDHLRAEFMGHNYGIIPFFLPELQRPEQRKAVTPNLLGLALLHDFNLWPIFCDREAVNEVYRLFDQFGLEEAEFLPYWKNSHVIQGQSEAVKCSAYHQPHRGVLLCLVNLTRQPQKPTLTVDWERLKSPRPVAVVDALNQAPVATQGESVTVEIEPLNFRLLWAQGNIRIVHSIFAHLS